MRDALRGSIAALSRAALLACSDPRAGDTPEQKRDSLSVVRDTSAPTQTDSLRYEMTVRDGRNIGEAMVTFRNPTADTVYFIHCNDAVSNQLQREVNGAWVTVWTSVQNGCFSAPIAVAPGDSLRRSVLLFDGYQPMPGDSALPPPVPLAPFRLVWTALVRDISRDKPVGEPLPLEQRVSNRFMLGSAPR